MASSHDGVSCDSCMRTNFEGQRFKCLICFDYDLCAACHDAGMTGNHHSADHPMQCLLTRQDFDLYYFGETVSAEHPQSLVCPFCGSLGFTLTTLHEHVANEHPDNCNEVICPVCAGNQNGDPNRMTDDLASHLAIEHISRRDTTHEESRMPRRTPPTRGGGFAAAARRGRHPQTQATGFAVSRENVGDPITELLAQLGGIRRANSNYSTTLAQIQQLQQQIGIGRQVGGSVAGGRRTILVADVGDPSGGLSSAESAHAYELLGPEEIQQLWPEIAGRARPSAAANNAAAAQASAAGFDSQSQGFARFSQRERPERASNKAAAAAYAAAAASSSTGSSAGTSNSDRNSNGTRINGEDDVWNDPRALVPKPSGGSSSDSDSGRQDQASRSNFVEELFLSTLVLDSSDEDTKRQ